MTTKASITHRVEWAGSVLPNQTVSCADCGTPIFEIRDGQIVTLDKHHGAWHKNAVQIQPIDRKAI